MSRTALPLAATIALLPGLAPGLALAQARASHCIAIAEGPERIVQAAWQGGIGAFDVRVRYVDHSMFLIETGGGATAVTDYNGYLGPTAFLPDVVTMNRAHSSHWTANPSPSIPEVLRGWEGEGQAVEVADLFVRNVPTDIRGGMDAIADGNSIYVFEAGGLCIAHLGHLHHVPDDVDFAMLGRMDVVFAPVDGGLTLPRSELLAALETLKARVVIPMHWFGRANVERFVSDMAAGGYEVDRTGQSEHVFSLESLPERPTVMVLEPEWLIDPAAD